MKALALTALFLLVLTGCDNSVFQYEKGEIICNKITKSRGLVLLRYGIPKSYGVRLEDGRWVEWYPEEIMPCEN